ncbi:MAG TPA: hypothetical protein DG753_08580 [Clostridium sp.]|nr:hypothetical protein [Clostridium sp.]
MNYNIYGFKEILRALGYEPEYIFPNRDKTTFNGDKTTFYGNAQDNINDGSCYNLDDESEGKGSGAGGWNQFTGFEPNCNDVFNGFQKLYPELFIVMGEIIGNIISRKMPINVQNSFGNWLQLIGQAILTYNAQQQYFQGGPGRYFSPIYYNVSNPFCSNNSYDRNFENINCFEYNEGKRHKRKKVSQKDIAKLDNNINQLVKEINSLKQQIDQINYKGEQE